MMRPDQNSHTFDVSDLDDARDTAPVAKVSIDSTSAASAADNSADRPEGHGAAEVVPACPGPDCWFCNGAACNLCDCGPSRPRCEHAVDERHRVPAITTTGAPPTRGGELYVTIMRSGKPVTVTLQVADDETDESVAARVAAAINRTKDEILW
ncbi:MAG TPA: hypothetical protein VIV58_31855 [Kofleriaceae bacterium]